MVGLSADQIREAFTRLAEEIGDEPRQIVIAGGAAMVLLYGARVATKDVDAIAADRVVITAATRIARELDLPIDWLNDAAKGYAHGLALGDVVFRAGSLTVHVVAHEQLLAMKLSAWRDDVDIDDARLLIRRATGSADELWQRVAPYLVPGRELKARYAFEDLWEADHGHP